jgi:hypothetical protein
MEAQSKKKMKNKARLPRTAGLRTLTDLTTDLTKAGIDPSRVQERAVMIAKVRAAGRKRKRDEDGMDVDSDGHDEDEDNWASEGEDETIMDVDGEEGEEGHGTRRKHKRGKANSGVVIARKSVPRSNRQLAGMRDEEVRGCYKQHFFSPPFLLEGADGIFFFLVPRSPYSKYPKQRDYGISVSAGATCLRKRARATALSESKWCVSVFFFFSFGVPARAPGLGVCALLFICFISTSTGRSSPYFARF